MKNPFLVEETLKFGFLGASKKPFTCALSEFIAVIHLRIIGKFYV